MDIDGRSGAQFNFLVDRIQQKLDSWRFKQFSKAGRVLIINALLISLTTHVLQAYLIPKKIERRMTSILMNYWWGSSNGSRTIHWKSNEQLFRHKKEGGMGIRNIVSLNTTLCFKSAWRVHQHKNSLLSRMLVARYGGTPIELAEKEKKPTICSWSMRSMIKSAASLSSGMAKLLGNGQRIEVFKHKWVNGKTPTIKDGATLSATMQVRKATDLLVNDHSWNRAKLYQVFDMVSVQEILNIHVPTTKPEDEDYWRLTKDGRYTVKSAYWHHRMKVQKSRSGKGPPGKTWKILWQTSIQERDKVFMWRLLWNALPTGEQLRKRGINSEVKCVFCEAFEESREHLFRDCNMARRIWKASQLGLQITDQNINQNLMEWIGNFLIYFNNLPLEEENLILTFVSVLKAIWNARNAYIFQGAKINPRVILYDIERHLLNWKTRRHKQHIKKEQRNDTNNLTTLEFIKGTQHTDHMVTLQIDGSWKQDKIRGLPKAAVGWVTTEANGRMMHCGSKVVKARDPLQTEALAMMHGLQEGIVGSSQVLVHTDSTLLVQHLRQPDMAPMHIRNIIYDILHDLNRFDYVCCKKVIRSQVNLAHIQANTARTAIGR